MPANDRMGHLADDQRALSPRFAAAIRLEIAVNTGQDIGDAAEHTSQVLSEYVDDLHRACGDDWACKARVDRQWQARLPRRGRSPNGLAKALKIEGLSNQSIGIDDPLGLAVKG